MSTQQAAKDSNHGIGDPPRGSAGDRAPDRTLGVRSRPARAFADRRLEHFARHGFAAEGHAITDRSGRGTYVLRGGTGPRPIVLVHGGLSEASGWAPLAGRIPGDVVIPDRPGCGLSDPIEHSRRDYRQAAATWLLGLLDTIGAGRVDLVGNSMGGYYSIAFALAHPDRVRRLILVGAPAGLDRRLPLFLRLWGNRFAGPVMARAKVTRPGDPEALRRRVFPMLVADPDQLPTELLELAVAGQAIPGVPRCSHSMLRAVTDLGGWRPELSLRDEAVRLETATLFVWGELDAFAPPSSGRDLVARMARARIEVLAGTGHLPHLERPGDVAGLVRGFLDDDVTVGIGAEAGGAAE